MNKDNLIAAFFEFLNEKGVRLAYEHNFFEGGHFKSLPSFFEVYSPINWMRPFSWITSPEGLPFWRNLDEKWQKYLETLPSLQNSDESDQSKECTCSGYTLLHFGCNC
jgi:hypothetical protein